MSDATTAAPAARWEDFLDIFYAPAEVFRRRESAGFAFVLLALTAAMAILFYASQGPLGPAFQADFQRGLAAAADRGRTLSAEQLEGAQRMAAIFGTVGFAVFFPIGVLATGAALWGAGKLFGSVATLGTVMLVATYAQLPRLLQQVTGIVQGAVMDASSLDTLWRVSVGPARFFDPDAISPVLLAMLGRLDLFVIWSTVLLGIGLRMTGRISRGEAWLAAGIVWLLGALPLLAGTL